MLTRPANEGRVYVRRSDDKQEDSLRLQIRWAKAEAPKQGIDLNVSLDELQAAISLGEYHRGNCYIDDDIPGSVLNRPGFRPYDGSTGKLSHLPRVSFTSETD